MSDQAARATKLVTLIVGLLFFGALGFYHLCSYRHSQCAEYDPHRASGGAIFDTYCRDCIGNGTHWLTRISDPVGPPPDWKQ